MAPHPRLAAALLALALAAPAAGVQAAEAPCEGDECQGPAPAPEEVIPGTAVVAGPGNPPARFPKGHQPKKHHKAHHKPRSAR